MKQWSYPGKELVKLSAMLKDLWQLFAAFAKVGLFGFGGGPSFIPLLQEEVVNAKGWLSREQFMDAFAFGNALPGPITTKLAGYVGYRAAGWPGALAALLGLTLPSIAAMILLAALYFRYQDNPVISSFLAGVRPVVIALLILVVLDFAPSAFGAKGLRGQRPALWLVAGAAFVLAARFAVHPALLILGGGLAGLLLRGRA